MAELKVEQIISNGIHNVVVLRIKEDSGRTVYANLKAFSNLYSAQDQARMDVRGY